MVTPEAFAGALWVELRAFFGQQELRFRTSEAMAVSVGGTRAYQGLSGLPDIVARAVERARRMEFEFSCLPEQGKLLSVLAAGRSGGVIGETGTGYGVGLAWIVSAVSPATRVVSVERERERAEAAQALFRDYPNVTVVHGDWQELERYGPFDLLVIDGGGSGKKGEAPFDPVKWLTPTGAFVIDDFTPVEAWPPQHDGGVDSIRLYWLKHPELLTTEIRTSPLHSAVVGNRRPRQS